MQLQACMRWAFVARSAELLFSNLPTQTATQITKQTNRKAEEKILSQPVKHYCADQRKLRP